MSPHVALIPGADTDLSSPGARAAAVARAVTHLDAAPPGPTGSVRIELEISPGESEAWTIDFGNAQVRLAPDVQPDVTLRASLEDAARLATGRADGPLLYLGGRLEVV